MAKLTLQDPSSVSNETSFLAQIAENNRETEEALENTLSRDGTTPNQMGADLDMNSNFITNTPDPTLDGHTVNKGYLDAQLAAAILGDLSGTVQYTSEKGVANGYASLDSNGHVTASQIPTITENVRYIETYTELSAQLSGDLTDDAVFYVTGRSTVGDGGEGLFRYSSDDISTEVASDTQEGVYIPLDSDATGASGGFIRQYTGRADIRWFGAVGDDSTQNRDAIQGAIDVCGHILIPEGTFLVEDPGISVNNDNSIVGVHRQTSILKKVGGLTQLEPIVRETYSGSTFNEVDDFYCEKVQFVGNGDAALPSAKGAGLIRFYKTQRLIVRDCIFRNSKGYGLGLQGADSATNLTKTGPNGTALIENCLFYDNGLSSYLTGSDSDDGMDIKSSDKVVIRNCHFYNNGDKGLDVRCRLALIQGCYAFDNASSGITVQTEGSASGVTSVLPASAIISNCIVYNNDLNGITIVPQATSGVVGAKNYFQIDGCKFIGNTHNIGVASQGTNELVTGRLVVSGCISRDPVGSNHIHCSSLLDTLSVSGCFFENGSHGIQVNTAHTGETSVTGCNFSGMTGNGVNLSTNSSAVSSVVGNTFKGVAGTGISGDSNVTTSGNAFDGVAGAKVSVTGTNNRINDYIENITVASAATLGANEVSDVWVVTGTTTINNIDTSWSGREITIRFSTSCDVTETGNLVLSSSTFSATSSDILKLVCIGSNWFEVSRSAN